MNVDLIAETGGWLLLAATFIRATLSSLFVLKERVVRKREFRAQRQKFSDLSARLFDQMSSVSGEKPQSWHGQRKFRIARRCYENLDQSICSFDLVPIDNATIPTYRPGQFLTVSLVNAESGKPIRRCYSISEAPANHQGYYRISVKRLVSVPPDTPPGLVSNMLHDGLLEEDLVHVLPPNGDFVLDRSSSRPVVLIAGGVGITPLLSMLSWLAATQNRREVWLFYGVGNRNEHAYYSYLNDICQHRPNIRAIVFYSRPSPTCRKGVDFDVEGYVSVDAMRSVLNARNYEFYLCGPPAMMTSVRTQLLQWGVPMDDIMSESFGSALPNAHAHAINHAEGFDKGEKCFEVEFARSGERAVWSPNNGSLLELAEACGINARCLCRAGQCGTCKVTLKSGKVAYPSDPGTPLKVGTCLPCIAQPSSDLVLDM